MNREIFRIRSLDGGVVATVPPTLYDQSIGFANKTGNMINYVPGILQPIPEITATLANLGGSIRGFFLWKRASTGLSYLIGAYGTVIPKWDSATLAWVNIKTGLTTSTTRYDFAAIADQLAIVNGVDNPMLFNGTTVSTPAGFPNVKYLSDFNLRLIGAGNPSEPMAVYMSHPGDPTVWDETDITKLAVKMHVSPDDGEAVTCVRRIEDWVLIGKENQIYGLFGNKTTNFAIYSLDTSVGIGSHHACRSISGTAFFPDKLGNIYKLVSGGRADLISEPIQDYLKVIDKSRIAETWATVLPRQKYLISFPVTNGSLVFVWDVKSERWFGPWELDIKMSVHQGGDLIFAQRESNTFLTFIPDTAAHIDFETIDLDLGKPEIDKEVRTVMVRFRVESANPIATFDIQWRSDNDEDWRTLMHNAELDFPVGRQQSIRLMTPNSRGRTFQLRLVSTVAAPFSLLGCSILYGEKDVV